MPYSAQPALLPHPRRCLPGRPGFWPRPSLLTGAGLLTALLSLSPAVADLVPEPPAECVGKPDGTFCSLGDGTAGQCVTEKDARRPGRSYQGCKKDTHECDRLAVGAVCHGYLGKPAHCREFRSPERGETWRSCQADDPPRRVLRRLQRRAPALRLRPRLRPQARRLLSRRRRAGSAVRWRSGVARRRSAGAHSRFWAC